MWHVSWRQLKNWHFCQDLNLWSHKIEEKKAFTQGGFDPRTFRLQKESSTTVLTRQHDKLSVLKRQIVIATKMMFHFAIPILSLNFRVFVLFSKIPRGIWKISFDMFSYTYILSKNHSRSLLNFFLIGNPTLNCVDTHFFSSFHIQWIIKTFILV